MPRSELHFAQFDWIKTLRMNQTQAKAAFSNLKWMECQYFWRAQIGCQFPYSLPEIILPVDNSFSIQWPRPTWMHWGFGVVESMRKIHSTIWPMNLVNLMENAISSIISHSRFSHLAGFHVRLCPLPKEFGIFTKCWSGSEGTNPSSSPSSLIALLGRK